tara:strand:- start:42 stop:2063 length:2022 start_codon:yes stop_codon:yes gene_type:complete
MLNTTIQLRQKDIGASVVNNGDWDNQLSAPITIEAGDRVELSNAFVDTTDYSNQQIILNDDLDIELNICKTWNNWNFIYQDVPDAPNSDEWVGAGLKQMGGFGAQGSATPADLTQELVDNEEYIMCRYFGNTTGYKQLDSLNFSQVTPDTEWGGFSFEFIATTKTLKTITINIPKQSSSVGSVSIVPPSIEFLEADGITVIAIYENVPPARPISVPISIFNTSFDGITDSAITTSRLVPATVAINITIPAGRYNPNDLCSDINKQVVSAKNNKTEPGEGGYNTGALVVSNQGILSFVADENFQYIGTSAAAQDPVDGQAVMVRASTFSDRKPNGDPADPPTADVHQILGFDPAGGTIEDVGAMMLGTNQFELEYDESTNRFAFNYLHFPVYATPSKPVAGVSAGGQGAGEQVITTGLTRNTDLNNSPTTDGILKWITKFSGIGIMSASPSWFWSGQLGFDLDKLLIKYRYKQLAVPNNGNLYVDYGTLSYPIFNDGIGLTPGINSTAGRIIVDSMVIKNSDKWWDVSIVETLDRKKSRPEVVIGTQTDSIVGGKNALGFVIDSGYYLVEVNSKFENKLVGQNFYNTMIQGIINRYYSINTYTAGGQGLTYIHPEGAEPIILTSLHTRILMPDGSLAVLGDDNSVFLTITKTPQQPIIPKENTSKKIKDKYKKP